MFILSPNHTFYTNHPALREVFREAGDVDNLSEFNITLLLGYNGLNRCPTYSRFLLYISKLVTLFSHRKDESVHRKLSISIMNHDT